MHNVKVIKSSCTQRLKIEAALNGMDNTWWFYYGYILKGHHGRVLYAQGNPDDPSKWANKLTNIPARPGHPWKINSISETRKELIAAIVNRRNTNAS